MPSRLFPLVRDCLTEGTLHVVLNHDLVCLVDSSSETYPVVVTIEHREVKLHEDVANREEIFVVSDANVLPTEHVFAAAARW